ncbi:MAG: omptin family outer membrane protease [Spirochaetaceae bacterium]|nr:omptin family outer membrane protease [Spirochaetaceae bacterium]
MKKTYLIPALFITLGLSLSAEPLNNKGHSLSFAAVGGLLSGESEEIVYRSTSSSTKLSQLLWDLKPLAYAGVQARYSWFGPKGAWGVFAGVSSKFGIPGETGLMEDRDWVLRDYPDVLTNYSVHDNNTESAVLVDAHIGVSRRVSQKFLLKAFLSYGFMYFSWRAHGGCFLYADIDLNNDGKKDGGFGTFPPIDVISYEQGWHILSPAAAFYGEFNRYFDIELTIKLSPFIWFSAEDRHIMRDLTVTDTGKGGFFIEPGLTFSFKPKDAVAISLSVSYRNISGVRGIGVYDSPGEAPLSGAAGSGYSALDAGLTLNYKVF